MATTLASVFHPLRVRMRGPGGPLQRGQPARACGRAGDSRGRRERRGDAGRRRGFRRGQSGSRGPDRRDGDLFLERRALLSGVEERLSTRPGEEPVGRFVFGLGAVALGIGLAMLASPILAATSGFLHAAGKFGRGLDVERDIVLVGRRVPAMTLYRGSVLLSRVPAICVALASILGAVEVAPTGDAVRQSILPATMLVCYALWATADIQLMSEGGAIIRPVADSAAALWRRVLGYT